MSYVVTIDPDFVFDWATAIKPVLGHGVVKNVCIDLSDISGVDVEIPGRRSISLRIITSDFRSRLYVAGCLRDKDWKELKQDLKFIGIPVRNEIGI